MLTPFKSTVLKALLQTSLYQLHLVNTLGTIKANNLFFLNKS